MRGSLLGMASRNMWLHSVIPRKLCHEWPLWPTANHSAKLQLKPLNPIAPSRRTSCSTHKPNNVGSLFQSKKLPLLPSGAGTEDTVKETSNWNCPGASKCFRLKVTEQDSETVWVVCISSGPHPRNLVVIMVVNDQNRTLADDVWTGMRMWVLLCTCTQFTDLTLKFPHCAHQNGIGAAPEMSIHSKQLQDRPRRLQPEKGMPMWQMFDCFKFRKAKKMRSRSMKLRLERRLSWRPRPQQQLLRKYKVL